MQLVSSSSLEWDGSDGGSATAESAIARLVELLSLDADLAQRREDDRPVPLTVLRHAVFAAYLSAISAGAGALARQMVLEARARRGSRN